MGAKKITIKPAAKAAKKASKVITDGRVRSGKPSPQNVPRDTDAEVVPIDAAPETVLLLRTCDVGGRAYGGFVWPLEVGAVVEPERWQPTVDCGHGLHGLLWGEGYAGHLSDASDAVWMVIEALASDVVVIGGKAKARRATVRFVGSRVDAVAFLQADPRCAGHAVAYGTATAGDGGTATAGDQGVLVIEWYDAKRGVYRRAIGEVGEGGLEPNVAHFVVDGKLVKKP